MRLAQPSTRRSRLLGPVPLTPMVDVVFLLLIYFLLTSTVSIPESTLSPALQAITVSGGAPSDLEPQVITVEAGADGLPVYRVGARAVRTRAELTLILDLLPKEAGVFVRAAPDAPVDALAQALQACEDSGFIGVTYVPGGAR